MVTEITKLNNLQLTLLKLFNSPMKDEEIVMLKRVLVQHFSKELEDELLSLQNRKHLLDSDFEDMLSAKS